jgi:transposase
VTDPLFAQSEFFDPRDLVQVKYEMVRSTQVDGRSVTEAAAAFGFSRPSFYQAQAALQEGGLSALVPLRRGPRKAHKLTTEILDFLRQNPPSLRAVELARRVEERFDVRLHPRTIERALKRAVKKR